MQMRTFFRKGYQCEGYYDSLQEDGTGFGREIYEDGNYFYEGFYKDGLRHGFGRYIWAQGDYYIGYFSKGLNHGQGKHVFNDGTVEEGKWLNDSFQN